MKSVISKIYYHENYNNNAFSIELVECIHKREGININAIKIFCYINQIFLPIINKT